MLDEFKKTNSYVDKPAQKAPAADAPAAKSPGKAEVHA